MTYKTYEENIWLVPTIVKESKVHGLGRFAQAKIAKGTPVLILQGEVVLKTGVHIPIIGTEYCIECPQTYVNHSPDPNLVRSGQILFLADKDIKPGDELLLDYSTLTSSKMPFM